MDHCMHASTLHMTGLCILGRGQACVSLDPGYISKEVTGKAVRLHSVRRCQPALHT